MFLRLVHDQPVIDLETRVTRMEIDAMKLRVLDADQIKPIYDKLEAVRDALSVILDRADGKNA